jgi:hypothetical protein
MCYHSSWGGALGVEWRTHGQSDKSLLPHYSMGVSKVQFRRHMGVVGAA